jgi:hypothetical protein
MKETKYNNLKSFLRQAVVKAMLLYWCNSNHESSRHAKYNPINYGRAAPAYPAEYDPDCQTDGKHNQYPCVHE